MACPEQHPGFTPGPWRIGAHDDSMIVAGAHGLHIAQAATTGLGHEGPANARLIAAAPDLYAAISAAEAFMAGFEGDELQEGLDEQLADVRAAVAKAGVPGSAPCTRRVSAVLRDLIARVEQEPAETFDSYIDLITEARAALAEAVGASS